MKVWIVTMWRDYDEDSEVIAVVTSQEAAMAMCDDDKISCQGPFIVDKDARVLCQTPKS